MVKRKNFDSASETGGCLSNSRHLNDTQVKNCNCHYAMIMGVQNQNRTLFYSKILLSVAVFENA